MREARTLNGSADHLVECEVVEHGRRLRAVARELDDVRDECRELLELVAGRRERHVTICRREIGVQREQIDVRADGGDGRAELVGGIGDQRSLRLLASLECGEHRVEPAREPADLVRAVATHPAREITRLGDLLGGVREPHQRADRRAAHEEPEQACEEDTTDADGEQRISGLRQRFIDLVTRASNLDRDAVADRDREHPQVDAVDRRVLSHLGRLSVRNRECRVRDGELLLRVGRPDRSSVREEQLGRPLGATEPRCRPRVGVTAPPRSPGPSGRGATGRGSTRGGRERARTTPPRRRRRRRRRPTLRRALSERGSSRLTQGVADAADRVDQSRLVTRLGLAAEIADVDLERIRRRAEVVAPDAVEHERARQTPGGGCGERARAGRTRCA